MAVCFEVSTYGTNHKSEWSERGRMAGNEPNIDPNELPDAVGVTIRMGGGGTPQMGWLIPVLLLAIVLVQ